MNNDALIFITGEDDLADIMDEVLTIKSMYFALGRSLRLKNDDLQAISEKYNNESKVDRALNDVLLLWLRKQYNVDRFGPPTWQMLVEAVDKKSGGNNHELAKQIALNHQAGIYVLGVMHVHVCIVSLLFTYNNIRVYIGITRQSILWDIHTNKCGSCQLLGHSIVSYEICYLLNCIHSLLFLMWVYAYLVLK